MTAMDWLRLQKALSVEAERGFNDLVGNQYRFSEFLCMSLSQPPAELPPGDRQRLQEVSAQFANYSDLTFAQRQHLVADTRRFLHQMKRAIEQQAAEQQVLNLATSDPGASGLDGNGKYPSSEGAIATKKPKQPRTTALVEPRTKVSVALDQAVTYLPGIGAKNSEKLAKLGLHTVRDVLYYYPRDHVDYARQVNIRDLVPGETVTLIATVKRCNCFNSPRNAKLTIFELTVRDSSGQLKLSRFYAGNRYRNRGWQEQQKRLYPPGAVLSLIHI